jgi:predicted signal transduction protein with EAL and GGDEF domain
MSTTAEGVETQEQFAILAAEGCANVQGYLLSKPRPAADVAEMLATLNVGLSELRPINGPARPRRPTVAALRLPAYAAAPGAGA